MSETDPIVIVGGGILGAAMAYAISQKGEHTCLLLERRKFASGVTEASGGMLRVYHREQPLADLALQGFQAFEAFHHESKESCHFRRTGFLYIERAENRSLLEQASQRLGSRHYPMEVLSAEEARERFPHMHWSDGDVAVYEPAAGYADPVLTTRALIHAAERNGVTALEDTEVERLLVEDGRVIGVRAGGRDIPASTVILTSGTWSQGLLQPLGLDLGLYNKAIQTVRLAGDKPSEHPCFYDAVNETFGRPEAGPTSRVGIVLTDRHPEPGPLPLDLKAANRAQQTVEKRFSELSNRQLAGGVRTVDSYVDDRLGLAEYSDRVEGLYLCLGWGGTGFKVALALANQAADAILPGKVRA